MDERCVESPSLGLESNLGRLPVVSIGDKSIGQSTAINFYFASEYGLMGKNNFEAAQVVAISEHLRELNASFQTLNPLGVHPDSQAMNKWFDGGAKDVTGHAEAETQNVRYLTWWMGRIERVLGPQGFAVGDRLSLADILLYNTFAETETLRDGELVEGPGCWRRGPMGDQGRMDAALAKHPRIKACCATVANNKNIQKWLAMKEF